MELQDIQVQDSFTVTFKVLYGSAIPHGIGTLIKNRKEYIFLGVKLNVCNEADRGDLDFHLGRGNACLCEVAAADKTTNVMSLLCCFFNRPLITVGSLNIYLPEKILNASKAQDKKKYMNELPRKCYLTKRYDRKTETYFVVQGNPEPFISHEDRKAIDAALSDREDMTDEEVKKQKEKEVLKLQQEARRNTAFSIVGTNIRIDAEKWQIGSGYSVRRLITKRNKNPQSNYTLVKGTLSFSSEREAISKSVQEQLNGLKQSGGSYLDAWDKYAEERGERLLRECRAFGFFKIAHIEVSSTGKEFKIFLQNFDRTKIKHRTTYDIVRKLPDILQDSELTWTEYMAQEEEDKPNADLPSNLEFTDYDEDSITVTGTDKLKKFVGQYHKETAPQYYVILSITGEKIQLKRQAQARSAITQGSGGISHLGLLLEEKALIPQCSHVEKGVNISLKTYDKVFKMPPTDTQRNAITMALQTPDIALIQGPPGTGKTTVITAIVEELNNRFNKTKNTKGAVLLSSFQHAAVENILERLRVNSVPTPKAGTQKDRDTFTEHIEKWAEALIGRIKAQNPELNPSVYELELKGCVTTYKHRPSETNKKALLDTLERSPDISARLRNKINEAKQQADFTDAGRNENIQAVRALRITPQSFADDGKERCKDVLNYLERQLDKADREILQKYASVAEIPQTAALNDLQRLKRKLLLQCIPPPHYVTLMPDSHILALYDEAIRCIEENRSKKDKNIRYQYAFLEQLESNPIGIQNAITDCAFSIAATAQQSVGSDILKFKNSIQRGTLQEVSLFDTVIIDEAARAAPPDLLIPMVCAARRIILVGDHRQLPQLIDEEIEKAVMEKEAANQSGNAPVNKDYYTLSMFEYMFKRLKELEAQDGIKRTITLDAQYRMHPVLGKFASAQFYEVHGEYFDSPRPASDFSHTLPGIENKPCVWIDVPLNKGSEERAGTSWKRNAEIREIIKYIRQFSENSAMTFGIISFYAAQCTQIVRELKNAHIDTTKVKVGSVDAFQGMEFDVVFLSAVRCNKHKRYGFLTMTNRLCVAMTRQKKVLIVVGDRAFLTSEDARLSDNIPQIGAFYDLCEKEGCVLCV